MAHGGAIKAAYAGARKAALGDTVAFYNMNLVQCGPYPAKVIALGEYATRVDLLVRGEVQVNVDHRGATDTGRLWDWK